jgi:N6-L-threonylcarbamoyladenine synthase
MGIMRWALYERLKMQYPDVQMTYGYITKHTRITNGLPKEHYIDARCISGHPLAEPSEYVFYQKKVRCHNRQIHKLTISKGGYRKLNQAPYSVHGFKLNDEVFAKNKEWYIHGRRTKGSFVLKNLSGEKIEIMPSKIKRLHSQNGYITERRAAIPPAVETVGSLAANI